RRSRLTAAFSDDPAALSAAVPYTSRQAVAACLDIAHRSGEFVSDHHVHTVRFGPGVPGGGEQIAVVTEPTLVSAGRKPNSPRQPTAFHFNVSDGQRQVSLPSEVHTVRLRIRVPGEDVNVTNLNTDVAFQPIRDDDSPGRVRGGDAAGQRSALDGDVSYRRGRVVSCTELDAVRRRAHITGHRANVTRVGQAAFARHVKIDPDGEVPSFDFNVAQGRTYTGLAPNPNPASARTVLPRMGDNVAGHRQLPVVIRNKMHTDGDRSCLNVNVIDGRFATVSHDNARATSRRRHGGVFHGNDAAVANRAVFPKGKDVDT